MKWINCSYSTILLCFLDVIHCYLTKKSNFMIFPQFIMNFNLSFDWYSYFSLYFYHYYMNLIGFDHCSYLKNFDWFIDFENWVLLYIYLGLFLIKLTLIISWACLIRTWNHSISYPSYYDCVLFWIYTVLIGLAGNHHSLSIWILLLELYQTLISLLTLSWMGRC